MLPFSLFFIFFIRKLFQSIRLYIKGILNGQPATHLQNTLQDMKQVSIFF